MSKLILMFQGFYNPETTLLYAFVLFVLLFILAMFIGPAVALVFYGVKIICFYGIFASMWNHWDESSWLKIILCIGGVCLLYGPTFFFGI